MGASGSVDRDGFALDYVREGQGMPILILGSPPYYRRAFPAILCNSFDIVFGNLRFFVSGPARFLLLGLAGCLCSQRLKLTPWLRWVAAGVGSTWHPPGTDY